MPFFSPDGQWIAFFADGKLKKVAAQGGSPVTLCDAPGPPRGASWGDDNNIIAAFNGGMTGLVRVSSAGGAPTSLTERNKEKGESADGWPQVLPGSQALVFTSFVGRTGDANVDALSFKTGERKTLHRGGFFGRYLATSNGTGHLVYMHQNTLFAAPFDLRRMAIVGASQPVLEDVGNNPQFGSANFDYSQTGTFAYAKGRGELPWSISWLDRAGNTQPLQLPPGFYETPRFSPDSKRLAFAKDANFQGEGDIWITDLERDTTSRLTSLPGQNGYLVWTPDGRDLIFMSRNQPSPGIYWIRADGAGEPQRLTDGKISQIPSSIFPDGKRLAYYQQGEAGFGIWTAPLEGDEDHPRLGRAEPFLRLPNGGGLSLPAFSPDGHWLAYSSNETGTNELYVRPFPGPGGKSQISTGGGRYPIWSRNRRELFFLSPRGGIMVAAYTANRDSFTPGKPQVWSPKRLLVPGAYYPYDLAPDGKRFAVVLYAGGAAEQEQQPTNNVTVLLNFFDELRRRVPVNK